MANKRIRALVFILAFAIAGYVIVQYGVIGAGHKKAEDVGIADWGTDMFFQLR